MEPRIGVFDIEIAREVEEVGGWEAVRRGEAGVSSIAIYDSSTRRFHVYGPAIDFDGDQYVDVDLGTLETAAQHLNSCDLIVGFNNIAFDTPVFENVVGIAIEAPQYDILSEVWRALDNERLKGYRLGEIARRTINMEKTFSGQSAPKLFKSGRFFELIDYNINDVALTRDLCNFINKHGYIIDHDGNQLAMEPMGVEIG